MKEITGQDPFEFEAGVQNQVSRRHIQDQAAAELLLSFREIAARQALTVSEYDPVFRAFTEMLNSVAPSE